MSTRPPPSFEIYKCCSLGDTILWLLVTTSRFKVRKQNLVFITHAWLMHQANLFMVSPSILYLASDDGLPE